MRLTVRLLALAWLVGCAPLDPGQLTIVDETQQLQADVLQIAAEPILQRGARVLIFLTQNGGKSDVEQRLRSAGHWHEGQIAATSLSLYVSLQPHYSELGAGSRWSDLLPGPELERIRSQTLNPALRTGAYQKALQDCLRQLSQQMDLSGQRQRRWRLAVLVVLAIGAGLWGFSQTRLADWIWRQTPRAREQALLRAQAEVRNGIAELEKLAPSCPEWAERLQSFLRELGDVEACSLEQLRQSTRRITDLRNQWRSVQAAQTACRSRQRDILQLLQGFRQMTAGDPKYEEWRGRLDLLAGEVSASLDPETLDRIKAAQTGLYAEISQEWQTRFPDVWNRRVPGPCGPLDCEPSLNAPVTPAPSEAPLEIDIPHRPAQSSEAGGEW